MTVPSDDLDKKIYTGTVAIIAIPTALALIILILLAYLTFIVSAFNHSQSQSACRGRVSQEIQEQFRTDVSALIAIAGQPDDGPAQQAAQNRVLDQMADRPNYVTEVKRQCHQDLGTPPKPFVTPATSATQSTTTTLGSSVPEE